MKRKFKKKKFFEREKKIIEDSEEKVEKEISNLLSCYQRRQPSMLCVVVCTVYETLSKRNLNLYKKSKIRKMSFFTFPHFSFCV